MKLINVNGFLAREVMGGRKSCSEYIFPKKSPQVCSAVNILDLVLKQHIIKYCSHYACEANPEKLTI